MRTRREMFSTRTAESTDSSIPTKVSFKIDKETKRMARLDDSGKLIVALRKVLATMSQQDPNGCRYYLDGERVDITRAITTTVGRQGEPQKYRAGGRARVGVCHPQGHKSSITVQFSLSFGDTKDERGLPDVEYFDPTSIGEI